MDSIIRSAIARIDVMQEGRPVSRGTGSLVAEGLVLTALHVVADRNQPALAPYPGEIVLTFPGGAVKASILQNYWDRLADWVLLRCETPPPVQPLPLAELREDGIAWETYGFPDANPRDGMVNIGEVSNRLGALQGSPVFQLFSREAAAGQGAPVKGLSGGPVIVQNALVGLLRFALMKDNLTVAGTLYACPVASVLAKAGDLLPLPDPCFGLPGLPRQPLPPEPFRYLAWFTAKEAEVFFGRNREIRQMYERLMAEDAPPILLLYGQTGVGKSSFLDAGLLPRLRWYRQVCYLRRDPQAGLRATLRASLNLLGGEQAESAPDLGAAWRAVEQNGGKPLVVFFDQVEEVYTRPNPQAPEDLEEFAREIGQVFGASHPPSGRLVLSFRKEWFPEIQKQVEANGLSYGRVFLEGLDRAAVVEAATGLTLTARLRQFYGLTIQPGMADQIASDLLADRDSPIAPTLQILLTKMWRKATAQSRSAPAFSIEQYESLKKEGVLLGDFLDQQLAALKPAHAEWVDSGLALDLLAYHTTPMLTAQECSLDNLLAQYKHRAADVPALIQELETLFLLSDTSRDDGQKATRLCHDTLAPLVRQRYATSEQPGQKARRIIESRVDDWVEGSATGLLDDGLLETVERGAPGMRLLSPKERKLIEASRVEQRKRRRSASILRTAAAAVALLIAATAVYALFQRSNAQDQEKTAKLQLALNDSGRLLGADPVSGLMLAVAAVARAMELKSAFTAGELNPKIQSALNRALNSSLEESVIATPSLSIAWSPDGTLAILGPPVLHMHPGGMECPLEFLDAAGKQILQTASGDLKGARLQSVSIAFSPDGQTLAQALGKIYLSDRRGKALPVPAFGPNAQLLSMSFAPDGSSILTGSDDGYLRSWDLQGNLRWEKPGATTPQKPAVAAVSAAKSPDGKFVVASGGSDDAVHLWSSAGEPLAVYQQHGESISALAMVYRRDGSWRVLSGGSDGATVLFGPGGGPNPGSLELQPILKASYNAPVCHVAFNSQGTVAAVATQDGTVRILDAQQGENLFPEYHPGGPVCPTLVFDPTGSRLAVGDGPQAHLLNLERANLIGAIAVNPGAAITQIRWSPKGDRIAASGIHPEFDLVDPRTGAVQRVDNLPSEPGGAPLQMTGLAFNHDGSLLATALGTSNGVDHLIRLWDSSGKVSRELRYASANIQRSRDDDTRLLAFTGDGRFLAGAAQDGTARVWDLAAGGQASSFPAPILSDYFSSGPRLALSPDGRTIARYYFPNNLGLWGLDGKPLGVPVKVMGLIRAVAFSLDGQSLFVWNPSQILRWRIDNGKLGANSSTVTLQNAPDAGTLAISPDEHTVFVGGQTIGMWSTATGERIAEFTGDPGGTSAMDISPDGSTLASGGADGGIRLWRANWQQWLQAACEQLGSHTDFMNPSATATLQKKLLQRSVSFGDEDIEYARKACRQRFWQTQEHR